MRITIFVIIFWSVISQTMAQGEIAAKDVKIYIGPDQQILGQKEVNFLGQKSSRIDWKETKEEDFLDLQKWKISRQLKDENPTWKLNLQETRLKERAGYVLECVGECRSYRGLGYANMKYGSSVLESDEIFTMKDSYLWIFLLDGTLVRLSPESSITLKEINRGKSENMIYARLNTGNILWWSRSNNKFKEKNIKETDSLFLPLSMYEANSKQAVFKVDEDDLFAFLQRDKNKGKKYDRLNQLIEKSNIKESFDTRAFLTFPNGSVYAKNIVAEFIILNGNDSYIKSRGKEKQGLLGQWEPNPLHFFYRGFNNTNEVTLEVDKWYRVGKKGRVIAPEDNVIRFAMGEFITSNIPSILIGRELLYQRYSGFMHDSNMTSQILAEKYGHRMWGTFDNSESDLSKRIRFLKEYTRRVETTNLVVMDRFNERLKKRGEKVLNGEFSAKYFRRAMAHFYNYREGVTILTNSNEILNSERKKLWKRIHERR